MASEKRRIGVLIDWYLPGYKAGGPIRSCANIIAHLKNDFNFSVITSDSDFGDTESYGNIKSNEWNLRQDGTRVFYFSKWKANYQALKNILRKEKFDVLYMNSLFSVYFTLFPLMVARFNKLNCRLIVAPRGMLGKGALKIKPVKKKLFLFIARILGLYKKVIWHASTEQEKKEIINYFSNKAVVVVALNLSSPVQPEFISRKKEKGKLNLVFFSRISVKKNLHLVFEFLSKLPPRCNVNFDFYGLREDADYWKLCEDAMAALPENITASYQGTLTNEELKKVLANYHFSILPTMHENFGHSIIESFAAGCPAIISNQTPWHELEKNKCGWDISLDDKAKFVSAIEKACMMNQQEFNVWSKAALNMAQKITLNNTAINQNRELFLSE